MMQATNGWLVPPRRLEAQLQVEESEGEQEGAGHKAADADMSNV